MSDAPERIWAMSGIEVGGSIWRDGTATTKYIREDVAAAKLAEVRHDVYRTLCETLDFDQWAKVRVRLRAELIGTP